MTYSSCGGSKELRVAIPGAQDDRNRTARVQYASGGSLTLWEPGVSGQSESIKDAIDQGGDFVIYDNPSGMLDGRWSSVGYDTGTGMTWFTDAARSFSSHFQGKTVEFKIGISNFTLVVSTVDTGRLGVATLDDTLASNFSGNERYRAPDLVNSFTQNVTTSGFWEAVAESGGNTHLYAAEMSNFGSHMVGWKVVVNTKRPSYHTIISVAGNDELVVEGDLTDPAVLAQTGDWFRIITPYTLDSATGEQHDHVVRCRSLCWQKERVHGAYGLRRATSPSCRVCPAHCPSGVLRRSLRASCRQRRQ